MESGQVLGTHRNKGWAESIGENGEKPCRSAAPAQISALVLAQDLALGDCPESWVWEKVWFAPWSWVFQDRGAGSGSWIGGRFFPKRGVWTQKRTSLPGRGRGGFPGLSPSRFWSPFLGLGRGSKREKEIFSGKRKRHTPIGKVREAYPKTNERNENYEHSPEKSGDLLQAE